jgi:uncharacterized protein (DUF1778 family)
MRKKKLRAIKKLSPDQTRTERIEILVTPPERTLIEEAVAQHKTTLSHLIRDAALILSPGIPMDPSE